MLRCRKYLHSLPNISVVSTERARLSMDTGQSGEGSDEDRNGASVGAMVLSPPWGGQKYLNQSTFDLRNLPECCGCGLELFKLAALNVLILRISSLEMFQRRS